MYVIETYCSIISIQIELRILFFVSNHMAARPRTANEAATVAIVVAPVKKNTWFFYHLSLLAITEELS